MGEGAGRGAGTGVGPQFLMLRGEGRKEGEGGRRGAATMQAKPVIGMANTRATSSRFLSVVPNLGTCVCVFLCVG